METELITVTKENIDDVLARAGRIAKEGGLVAFPTETVYGLGADALSKEASKKIYAAKGRPSDNPLIVHIAEFDDIYKIVDEVPKEARILAEKFWPGPLTMRFKKNSVVPDETTGGLDTVAVRMPDNAIALGFIKAAGGYIAAPSANKSGRPSPTEAKHVYEDMNGIIPMILDGGAVGIGIESTIVDFAVKGEISILRPGYITKEMIENLIHTRVMIDEAVDGVSKDAHPKAPGMKYRHYAPKASLTLIEGEDRSVITEMKKRLKDALMNNRRIGLMITKEHNEEIENIIEELITETGGKRDSVVIKIFGSSEDELSIAQGLYKSLREYDEEEVSEIFSESVSHEGLGRAVYNRLIRAAGHQVIKV